MRGSYNLFLMEQARERIAQEKKVARQLFEDIGASLSRGDTLTYDAMRVTSVFYNGGTSITVTGNDGDVLVERDTLGFYELQKQVR